MASLNFENLFELDVNPGGTASYKRIGMGFTSAAISNEEEVNDTSYLDGEGGKTSTVVGFQHKVDFSGERVVGDLAQDYVLSKVFDLSGRTTNYRCTLADGTIITGSATICDIVPFGGDANAIAEFSFSLKINGKPAKTDPVTAITLTTTVAAGSAVGTTKFTATAGSTNHLAYTLKAAATVVKDRQYVNPSAVVAYTSAANITATVGQNLNMYEIDAFNHVVKFTSELLDSADVMST
jgi:hypothetical protein